MKNVRIINVLSQDAYEDCHIKGSINVPYASLAEFIRQFPKDDEFIVYCASYSCPLSKKAWKLLKELGYMNVYAYEGGIAEWYQKGYPTEGPCSKDYIKQQHEKVSDLEEVQEITADLLKQKL